MTRAAVSHAAAVRLLLLVVLLACGCDAPGSSSSPAAAASAPPTEAPPATAITPPAPAAPEPTASAMPDATAATPMPRDVPGRRSFDDPAAPLPDLGLAPRYASSASPCPEDMVLVAGLRCSVPVQECLRWVDDPGKPERSCGEFRTPVPCRGARHRLRFCIDRRELTPPGASMPLVHVSWGEARVLCGKLGKRLCTETEWEFSCEGPDASPYPYGATRDGARCNHDLDELFTPRGKLIDRRVSADARPECESPFGVLNLVGNVDEWTTRPENAPPHRSILRGGWWLKGRNRCRAATESHKEIYAGPQTGVRCCKAAR